MRSIDIQFLNISREPDGDLRFNDFLYERETILVSFTSKDPSGNLWQRGTLTPGQQYESTYTWSSAQNGGWTWELNQANGLAGQVKLTVRSDV